MRILLCEPNIFMSWLVAPFDARQGASELSNNSPPWTWPTKTCGNECVSPMSFITPIISSHHDNRVTLTWERITAHLRARRAEHNPTRTSDDLSGTTCPILHDIQKYNFTRYWDKQIWLGHFMSLDQHKSSSSLSQIPEPLVLRTSEAKLSFKLNKVVKI